MLYSRTLLAVQGACVDNDKQLTLGVSLLFTGGFLLIYPNKVTQQGTSHL